MIKCLMCLQNVHQAVDNVFRRRFVSLLSSPEVYQNDFFVFSVFILLLMPELVYGIFDVRFRLCWLPEKIAVVGLLAVILNLTPYGRFKVFWSSFLPVAA